VVLGSLALPVAASAADVNIVYGWGDNYVGQVGVPVSNGVVQGVPVPVAGSATNVTQVSAGDLFNVALHADGTVWAWGLGGRLGDGTSTQNSYVPVPVPGLPGGIVQVAAGSDHALALAADGSVWAWGSNAYGALGMAGGNPTTAVRVPVLTGVRQVAAGLNFSVALRTNGEVWTWGRGDHGQLGDGTHVTSRPTPARAPMAYGMTQVTAGYYHAMALRPGSLWAWGDNSFGQLGNGTTVADSATAVRVDRQTDHVTQIDAGPLHNLALDPDGSIWAWGDNRYAALGIGVVDDPNGPFGHGRNRPVHVLTSGVTQISAGSENGLAVLADGGVLVWGLDLYGVLADGTPDGLPNPVPARAIGVTGVVQASIEGFTAVAIAHAVAMPNVIGEIKIAAVSTLQAAGLTVHVGTTPDDPICNRVGEVVSQSPSAGTVVTPGAHVSIIVAVPPAGGCF
jgi:alpha-tubulin suppressor-like RCC1 family protein